jgi:hypothetical protein
MAPQGRGGTAGHGRVTEFAKHYGMKVSVDKKLRCGNFKATIRRTDYDRSTARKSGIFKLCGWRDNK